MSCETYLEGIARVLTEECLWGILQIKFMALIWDFAMVSPISAAFGSYLRNVQK